MKLRFEYCNDTKGIWTKKAKIKTEELTFHKQVDDWTKFTGELNIPEDANFLRFSLINLTDGAETSCRNLDLRGK